MPVSVFNTLQSARVDTGQTSEERVTGVKRTTHQGIGHQNVSRCWILSDVGDFTNGYP